MDPTVSAAFAAAVAAGDASAAQQVARGAVAEYGLAAASIALLTPVMDTLSRQWEAEGGTLTLAQAYLAAKAVERCAEEAHSPAPSSSSVSAMGPVVLGNIEDDYHALGRKLVGLCLRHAGWDVVDLGCDVPGVDFVDTAQELGARTIAVSAMTYSTAANIRHVREEIDRRGLAGRVKLAVGGAVFVLRPELVSEVGGDGTAATALGAHRLLCDLWGIDDLGVSNP